MPDSERVAVSVSEIICMAADPTDFQSVREGFETLASFARRWPSERFVRAAARVTLACLRATPAEALGSESHSFLVRKVDELNGLIGDDRLSILCRLAVLDARVRGAAADPITYEAMTTQARALIEGHQNDESVTSYYLAILALRGDLVFVDPTPSSSKSRSMQSTSTPF